MIDPIKLAFCFTECHIASVLYRPEIHNPMMGNLMFIDYKSYDHLQVGTYEEFVNHLRNSSFILQCL